MVVDPKAAAPSGDEAPQHLDLAIVMSKGDKFFCFRQAPLNPVGVELQKEASEPAADPNAPEQAKEGAMPFFDLMATRQK